MYIYLQPHKATDRVRIYMHRTEKQEGKLNFMRLNIQTNRII